MVNEDFRQNRILTNKTFAKFGHSPSVVIRQLWLFAKCGYSPKKHSTKKGLGKNTLGKKDIRQKKFRRLVLFRQKIRPDHIRRVVIVPLKRLKSTETELSSINMSFGILVTKFKKKLRVSR